MDLKELGENLGLELDEFVEIVELFVTTADSDIEKIRDAIKENDSFKAQEAAHSLKGSAGNLGFMEISNIAMEAEKKAREQDLNGFDGMVNEIILKLEDVKNQLK